MPSRLESKAAGPSAGPRRARDRRRVTPPLSARTRRIISRRTRTELREPQSLSSEAASVSDLTGSAEVPGKESTDTESASVSARLRLASV
eukprot:341294-Hanusia_phi.AAC.1